MDLIRQNRLLGWTVAILAAANVAMVSLIWIRTDGGGRERRGQDSLEPMRRELGLSDAQAEAYRETQQTYRRTTKAVSDELNALKIRIADELFAPQPDRNIIDSLAARIGRLQAHVEMLRFEAFRGFVAACTEQQRAKLHPLLQEVFGRRPPSRH